MIALYLERPLHGRHTKFKYTSGYHMHGLEYTMRAISLCPYKSTEKAFLGACDKIGFHEFRVPACKIPCYCTEL